MPFKDKLKQLVYMKKYQEEKRAKLKEAEDLQKLEAKAAQIMRENIIGRRLYPITFKPPEEECKMPVIEHSCAYPPDLVTLGRTVMEVARDEDRMLITGEYQGWRCLGVEGLATATGRNCIKADGDLNEAIEKAISVLTDDEGYTPPYSLVYSGKKLIKKNEKIDAYYETPNLFRKDGKQKNMLLLKIGEDNFKVCIGRDLEMRKHENTLLFREIMGPIIKNPTAICEITWP